jgi:hypothetical protein
VLSGIQIQRFQHVLYTNAPNNSMLELLGLAAELVDEIISHLEKKALFNLCLTCSALRGIAQPYLFAQLTIHQRKKKLTPRKSRHSLYYAGGEDEPEPHPANPARTSYR